MTESTASIAWLAVSPFVGSFLGVVMMRFRSPLTIVFGRSVCATCGARLGPGDLVPLLSWLCSGGRCRHCGHKTGIFYPLIELAALAIAAWSVLAAPDLNPWASCILGWTLLALAVIDVRDYLLPDFLTIPLALLGLSTAWIMASSSLPDHLVGAACGLAGVVALRWAYHLLRGREGIGLGDAKLLAAAGAWVSWAGLPSVVLIGAVSGLTVAMIRGCLTGRALSYSDRVPFGAFLCLGIWIVWLYGPVELQLIAIGYP
jgi:leader peptidase (prepilin peptidase)/N-methyltransferase